MASFTLQSYYIKFRLNQDYNTNKYGYFKAIIREEFKLWNKKNEISEI